MLVLRSVLVSVWVLVVVITGQEKRVVTVSWRTVLTLEAREMRVRLLVSTCVTWERVLVERSGLVMLRVSVVVLSWIVVVLSVAVTWRVMEVVVKVVIEPVRVDSISCVTDVVWGSVAVTVVTKGSVEVNVRVVTKLVVTCPKA